MPDSDFVVEQLEELPWGPGVINLLEPLEVEVSTNELGVVTINARTLEQWAQGDSFEDALLELGAQIEEWFDAVSRTAESARTSQIARLYDTLVSFLPDEVLLEDFL